MIEVRVLGPLEVTVDGTRADLGGPRQRSVLARLAAGDAQVVSADRLIEDLYADEAPPRALASVQAYVSHLRRILEPGRPARAAARVLVTSPPGYALRLGRGAVDAWSFADEVRRAAELDDPVTVHDLLTTALASWRGAAFEEYAGLPWADLEASRLDQLRLAATERLAEAGLRLGRAPRVAGDLTRLTAEHPLREEAWRLLALALYQCGRQGDALAALRRARACLAGELGVDPGPALRKLEDDILAQAAHLSAPPPARLLAAPGATAAPAAGTRPTAGTHSVSGLAATPASTSRTAAQDVAGPGPDLLPTDLYVGRDAELAMSLRAAAEAESAARLRVVLVSGDAGAGKTALAGQVRQFLAGRCWIVAPGRCPEDDGAPPGWPWAEALRPLAASAPPADPRALVPLLGGARPADADAPAARFALHRATAAWLDAVSGTAPLLIMLDDLHRADNETLAILASVAADLAASRVLVLATYRPAEAGEPLKACLAALASREPTRVMLGGLEEAAAGDLIRATSTRPVDDATVAVITERTGGNPFFLKETARLLDSEGALAAVTGVPAGVGEVLQRRIARLPATAATILRQAAVIGMETSIDVLAHVSDAADDVLVDAVEAGLLTGLVTEPAAGRVRFAHALVRDTLYQGLSRLRRSRLHARAAVAIERHSPDDVAALAYHFAEAGTEPAAAARYSRLAAEQAEQRFAYHDAARLWEQAITCLDQAGGADARDWLDLVAGLVRALGHTGQLARARSWRRDAIRAATPAGDPALLARVITDFDVPRLWPAHEYGVTDHELIELAGRTLSRLPPGDELMRCRLLTTLAFELDGEESDRGYEAARQAVEMARRLGDPAALTLAINARDINSFRHDGLDERLRLGAELLALPRKPVTAEALGHLLLMKANSGGGDFAAADLHASQAGEIAERYDLPVIATRVSFYRALRTALDGDMDSSAEFYRRAAEQMGRLGMWQHGAVLASLGRLCLRITQDRTAEAVKDLEPFYRYPPWSATFTDTYALALAAAGRTAEARAVAGRPRPFRRDLLWLFLTGVRAMLAVAIDDRQRAESAYQALLPFAARPAGADTATMTLWPTALILGDLARHLGLPGARVHYEHALAIAERTTVTPWAAAARNRLLLGTGPSAGLAGKSARRARERPAVKTPRPVTRPAGGGRRRRGPGSPHRRTPGHRRPAAR